MLSADNLAYEAAFQAIELIAANCNIDMRHLHHRYQTGTARKLLRSEAAKLLRLSRSHDKATAYKVWSRHKPQATKR